MQNIKKFYSQLFGNQQTLFQGLRYVIVGGIATVIHYFIYFMLMNIINMNLAYTIGYFISFCINFILTTYFTFGTNASVKKGGGFLLSHLINYGIQILLLNFFVWLHVSKELAPLFVLIISIPISFIMIKSVFTLKIFK